MEGEYESRESGGGGGRGQKMNWCRNDSIDGCRCGGAQFSGTRSQPASMRGGQKARKIIGRWCDSIKWRTHTHTLDSCRLHFHGERPLRALLCDRISHDAQNRIDFRGQSNRFSTFFSVCDSVCDSDCRIIGFVSLHQMAFICSRFPPFTAIIHWNVYLTCGQCKSTMVKGTYLSLRI